MFINIQLCSFAPCRFCQFLRGGAACFSARQGDRPWCARPSGGCLCASVCAHDFAYVYVYGCAPSHKLHCTFRQLGSQNCHNFCVLIPEELAQEWFTLNRQMFYSNWRLPLSCLLQQKIFAFVRRAEQSWPSKQF